MVRTDSRVGLSELLSRVESQATGRLAELLAGADIGVEEWRVMTLLSDGLGHPMTETAQSVMLPAPTVTRLIDRMVADNLVYRRADEWDRRRLLVYMTDRGRALYERLKPLVSRHEQALVEAMGSDSRAAIEVLHRLDDVLGRHRT